MTIHIAKLSVGSTGIESLGRWQASLIERRGVKYPYHVTRMFPRRGDEVLDGGSIYWVIQGYFTARQRIVGLEPVTAEDGTSKCRIDLDPKLIPVSPIAKRPFQGWRYLKPEDAPADVTGGAKGDSLELTRRLSELGLL
ncbi:DUF1489 family protein [Parvularcula marina]|uniref:DUF1489 family protein n=1 Tax=Parvularcula marina TaxID=2292771 RepID=UPI0035114B0F